MTTTEVRRVQEDEGSVALARQPGGESSMAIATTRASQEVQAAMVIAKRFPRDETAAIARILQSCKRKGLAEAAVYSFPRGGTTVEGPSIRLAEAMAQAWGNLDFGIVELEQKNGESQVMAYAWDLETNTRQTKIFAVPHKRHTKAGDYKLTDPRDIYEMVANNGARRLRACILGVIPGDVQDSALAECNKTLTTGNKEPLIDRVRAMLGAFAELGVTKDMIEARFQHKADTINEPEILALRKIYRSLTDGMAKREDFFEVNAAGGGEASGESRTERLADTLRKTPGVPQEQRSAGVQQAEKVSPFVEGLKTAKQEVATGRPHANATPEPAKDPVAEPAAPQVDYLAQATEHVKGLDADSVQAFVKSLPTAIRNKAKEVAATKLDKDATEDDWRNVATNGLAAQLAAKASEKAPEKLPEKAQEPAADTVEELAQAEQPPVETPEQWAHALMLKGSKDVNAAIAAVGPAILKQAKADLKITAPMKECKPQDIEAVMARCRALTLAAQQ